jgi:hypothetical protein
MHAIYDSLYDQILMVHLVLNRRLLVECQVNGAYDLQTKVFYIPLINAYDQIQSTLIPLDFLVC